VISGLLKLTGRPDFLKTPAPPVKFEPRFSIRDSPARKDVRKSGGQIEGF
jgi:hypothetical protein